MPQDLVSRRLAGSQDTADDGKRLVTDSSRRSVRHSLEMIGYGQSIYGVGNSTNT
jgi:hypothetical protein